MDVSPKKLVTLFYPGPFTDEGAVQELKAGEEALGIAFADKEAYAFKAGTQAAVTGKDAGASKPSFGPTGFFGEVLSIDQLKDLGYVKEAERFQEKGFEFCIKARTGNLLGVAKGDRVYDPQTCRLVFELRADGSFQRHANKPSFHTLQA
jgi:hypothetical protein